MPEESMNIYKTARRAAGITQEAAAEQLGISVESVRAYETGLRIPTKREYESMTRQQRRRWYMENAKVAVIMSLVVLLAVTLPSFVG